MLSHGWAKYKEFKEYVKEKLSLEYWQELLSFNHTEIAYYRGYLAFNILEAIIPPIKLAKLAKAGKLEKVIGSLDGLTTSATKTGVPAVKASDEVVGAFFRTIEQGTEVVKGGTKNINQHTDEVFDALKKQVDDTIDSEDAIKLAKLKLAEKMWKEFDYDKFLAKPPLKPCFLAGTLVQTKDGHLPIEQIKVGTGVYCYDEIQQQLTIEKVSETYQNYTEKYLVITTQSGEQLHVTGQHLFYQKTSKTWIKAHQLKVGMHLYKAKSNTTEAIKTLKIIEKQATTYNLEVPKHHNYLVGNAGILAHNGPAYADLTTRKYAFYELYTQVRVGNTATITTQYIGKTTREDLYIRGSEHVNHAKRKGPNSKHYWKFKDKPQIANLNQGTLLEFVEMTEFESAIMEKFYLEDYKHSTGRKLRNIQNPLSKKSFKKYKALHQHLNPCIYFV